MSGLGHGVLVRNDRRSAQGATKSDRLVARAFPDTLANVSLDHPVIAHKRGTAPRRAEGVPGQTRPRDAGVAHAQHGLDCVSFVSFEIAGARRLRLDCVVPDFTHPRARSRSLPDTPARDRDPFSPGRPAVRGFLFPERSKCSQFKGLHTFPVCSARQIDRRRDTRFEQIIAKRRDTRFEQIIAN